MIRDTQNSSAAAAHTAAQASKKRNSFFLENGITAPLFTDARKSERELLKEKDAIRIKTAAETSLDPQQR